MTPLMKQLKARMAMDGLLGKMALPFLSFSAAFAGPSLVTNLVSNTIEFRSVAKPLVIQLDRISLPASALEDARIQDPKSEPANKPLVVDELKAGEWTFQPELTKALPNQNYLNWFATPIVAVSDYIAEAQAYQPAPLFPVEPSPKRVENQKSQAEDLASLRPAQTFLQPLADARRYIKEGIKVLDIAPKPNDLNSHVVYGRVELTKGLAFLPGSQNLTIVRYIEGQPTGEVAQIHYTEGTYRLRMRGRGGYLAATLTDDIGEVIGYGKRNITGDKNQIIEIAPVTSGLEGQVVSAHSFGSFPHTIANARIEVLGTSIETSSVQDGRFIADNVAAGSQFFLRASQKEFWPTLMMARAGVDLEVPLFPQSMITALGGLTLGRNKAIESVIWGQVIIDGHPVPNAQVELAGSTQNAVYFEDLGSAFLPQTKLKSTQQNGYFAFLNIPEGLQTLRVIIPGKIDHHVQVISVQRNHLTYTTFSFGSRDANFVTVGDGMNFSAQIPGTVRWMGSDITNEFSPPFGPIEITPTGGLGLHVLEVEAGSRYALTRQSGITIQGRIHTSVFQEEFLQKAQARVGVVYRPGTTRVVGLIQGRLGAVDLEDAHWNGEIVYFDENGNFVATAVEAENGGFVMFNVPQGLQSVQIAALRSTKRAVKLIVAEPDFVNVIYHQFQK